MRALLGRRRVLVAIIFVLIAVVATQSVVLAATVVRQGSVEYMKVATATDVAQTATTSWADVPGTALAMPIPSGEHDFFQITFTTAYPQCFRLSTSADYAFCQVRAMVDGQEVAPGPITIGDAAFGQQDYTNTMQWASTVLAPGTHYAKLQFRTDEADNAMTLYARTTTVIRARAY